MKRRGVAGGDWPDTTSVGGKTPATLRWKGPARGGVAVAATCNHNDDGGERNEEMMLKREGGLMLVEIREKRDGDNGDRGGRRWWWLELEPEMVINYYGSISDTTITNVGTLSNHKYLMGAKEKN
ncbi:hypothetical protein LguiB_002327 [Lonicera macranthoides]